MDLDELLEQFKMLLIWHKGVTVTMGILLAGMVVMIVFGIMAEEIRTLLIVSGVIFGICGVGLYLIVHTLLGKTKKVFVDYFAASQMSESEIRSLLDKHGIKDI